MTAAAGPWWETALVFGTVALIFAIFALWDHLERRRAERDRVLELRHDAAGGLWLRTSTGWHYAGDPATPTQEDRNGQPRRTSTPGEGPTRRR